MMMMMMMMITGFLNIIHHPNFILDDVLETVWPCDEVTRDGVWIGIWLYWTLNTHYYK
jgi:hypothetical protein